MYFWTKPINVHIFHPKLNKACSYSTMTKEWSMLLSQINFTMEANVLLNDIIAVMYQVQHKLSIAAKVFQ